MISRRLEPRDSPFADFSIDDIAGASSRLPYIPDRALRLGLGVHRVCGFGV
jgi:hypothetical protein